MGTWEQRGNGGRKEHMQAFQSRGGAEVRGKSSKQYCPLHQLSRKGRRNPLGWGGGWEPLGSYLRDDFLVTLPESF